MIRTLICLWVSLLWIQPCQGEDAAQQVLIVKVYPVGDLVAASTMMGPQRISHERGDTSAESKKALAELVEIITTMCSPNAVMPYTATLSLVVRHTKEGHLEVQKLLDDLNEEDRPSILFEYQALNLEGSDLTEEEAARWEILAQGSALTKQQTAELLELAKGQPRDFRGELVLKSGLQREWGIPTRPSKVIGRIGKQQNVMLRFDFQTGDDYANPPLFGSNSLDLSEGESGLFMRYFDGGGVLWLVSAKILEDEAALQAERVARRKAETEPQNLGR
ncbi:MAG: hypothetical protein AAF483_07430 [Planctomycetota bacterium]